jgi:hypothetical protein
VSGQERAERFGPKQGNIARKQQHGAGMSRKQRLCLQEGMPGAELWLLQCKAHARPS